MGSDVKFGLWCMGIGFILGVAAMGVVNQSILAIMRMWFTW